MPEQADMTGVDSNAINPDGKAYRQDAQLEMWQGLPGRSHRTVYLMLRVGNKLTTLGRLSVKPDVFVAALNSSSRIIPFVIDHAPFQEETFTKEIEANEAKEAAAAAKVFSEEADF